MASIIQPTNDWVKKLSEVKIDKSDLNKLIMNYFVIEGYKDAAETFSQECGISPSIDVDSINDRMNIKNAIQNGNVEEAIERVNDLNPEASILDTNPKLYFHLQQQRLIEYIRQGRVSEALEFAQDELAPLGEENPEFLEELERSMALLAFDDTTTSPVGDLLHPSQRLRTASELNAAILTSQSQEKDPKLPNLLKMLVWAQDELDEKAIRNKLSTTTLVIAIVHNDNSILIVSENADTNEDIVRVTNNDDDNTASINDTDISEAAVHCLYRPTTQHSLNGEGDVQQYLCPQDGQMAVSSTSNTYILTKY
nr:7905_t:CDS:2 [Entrophospora candida]